MKPHHIRPRLGDVFLLPLAVPSDEVAGSMNEIEPSSMVSFGQVLSVSEGNAISVALFDYKTEMRSIADLDLSQIARQKVYAIYETPGNVFSQRRWFILGTVPLDLGMPLQAYYWSPSQTFSHENMGSGEVISVPERVGKNLIRAGHSATSGVLHELARYHFRYVADFYNGNLDPKENFKPRESGLAWKFFPQKYKNPGYHNIA